MNKLDITKLLLPLRKTVVKYGPEILTGIGVGGLLTSTVLAVKSTPRAIEIINERTIELDAEELPKIEIVKSCWRCYVPSILLSAVSVSCLIGASATNYRRNAALATLVKVTETAYEELKESTTEVVGEKKQELIEQKVAQKVITRNVEATSEDKIIDTGTGDILFMDPLCGHVIKADENFIKSAVNAVNEVMLNENYVSLNSLYSELRMPYNDFGEMTGWTIIKGTLKVSWRAGTTPDDKPCFVLRYDRYPVYEYEKY